MRRTRERLAAAAIGLALALMLLMAFVAERSIADLVESADRVDHSQTVLSATRHVLSLLDAAISSQRAYPLTAEASLLTPYTRPIEELDEEVAQLRALV